ncbi:hypothetical protein LQ567_23690 [Niabella pedocola]|uniref:Uncharacterized protein n=1 Tax=Niabella pedocola TaxID=1752077 RepID=A0ABS8PZV0_9BACT|nr:hypothetical protein [Niabella pedocola]MCD2425807.1 hypothetical protein [Niabella pedocola]
MKRYTYRDLDSDFSDHFEKKRKQYELLGCLPGGMCTREWLIEHTLQLLGELTPVLAVVLNAELEAGNRIRTVCRWSAGGPLDIVLTAPFVRKYKAKHLSYLQVKDPWSGSGLVYLQYTTPSAPGQRLLAATSSGTGRY